MSILEFIFFGCVGGIIYAYFGYPLMMFILALGRSRIAVFSSRFDDQELPKLTVLIAARDEEQRLSAKLDDVMVQNYPKDRLQVIVVSDGSQDKTVDVAGEYSDQGVECVDLGRPMGKEAAQIAGIARAAGDYIIFTDVATRTGGEGFRGIAAALLSRDVGAVSSEDRFVTADGRMAGEGAYVRYEMWLRRLESRVSGLVGLSGSLFAVRRDLCDEWPCDVPSDFVVALRCARRGLKAVSISTVYGIYRDLKKDSGEFARKRRTALRGMAGLASAPEVLSFRRFGWFAFQVWSHKICRWLVPWLMLGALTSNVFLVETGQPYTSFFWLQILAYSVAGLASLFPELRKIGPIKIGFFFVTSNLALACAAMDFLRGRRVVQWTPSVR